MPLRIALACDHGGYELKAHVQKVLGDKGIETVNLGVDSDTPADYPDQARALVETILSGGADRGVLVCGTGIGISIAANRYNGIRAALCTDPVMARLSRSHNDANVLCLGGRIIGPVLAEAILEAFLSTDFDGGRHTRRIEKIETR